MKTTLYSLALAAATCGLAGAQATTAYTTPVGYVTQTSLSATDTVVGLPLRQSSAAAGAVSGAPDTTTIAGSAIVTVAGTPNFGAFANTHYVKFTSGPASGKFFAITANTSTTLTINLNGDTLTAVDTNTLVVSKFWTLGELFVPSASTSDPATTGNAIVVTTNTLSRRTEVLLPNVSGNGINLAASGTFFIFNGAWRRVGQPTTTSFDGTQLWPDNSFIIRQPTLTVATKYTISGEVDPTNVVVDLRTNATTRQDNFIGVPRPIDTTINGLALGNTPAFVTTTNTLSRRDELLVFNNAAPGRNKAASATYFYFNGGWRKVGQPTTTDFGTDIIPAGNGFLIRKSSVAGAPTSFWNNTPTY